MPTRSIDQRSLILIGPTGVGKTTMAAILGQRIGLPVISLDRIRYVYYHELGYDEGHAKELRQENFEMLIQYWQPFDAHAVVRTLAEHRDCIFDFGAVHSVYDDLVLLEKVVAALKPYPRVVLMLPSNDVEDSVRILHDRGKEPGMDTATSEMWQRIIRRFVSHGSNRRLAKQIVLTEDRTPEEVVNALLSAISAT